MPTRGMNLHKDMSVNEWFLAQAKPGADHVAKRNLERQGFATFQPMEQRLVARKGMPTVQARPLFPGYIFVSYPGEAAPWSLVNSTYGVARLVRFGDRPTPVPAQVMTELRDACDHADTIFLGTHLGPGDAVEVTLGPATTFLGEVERLSPNQRALVLLDFMGKQTRVSVPTVQLKAASGHMSPMGATP